MLVVILMVLFALSGIIMLFSGVWLLIEVLLLFRIQLTNSLNASLDIIRVIKSHKAEGVQDKEQKSQLEKEEIAIMEHLLTTLSDIHAVCIKKNIPFASWRIPNEKICKTIRY
jgi:hypothetical protein